MAKRKRRKKLIEDTYKVSIQFKRWMDSQIDVMCDQLDSGYYTNRWDIVELEVQLEAYSFIRGLLK